MYAGFKKVETTSTRRAALQISTDKVTRRFRPQGRRIAEIKVKEGETVRSLVVAVIARREEQASRRRACRTQMAQAGRPAGSSSALPTPRLAAHGGRGGLTPQRQRKADKTADKTGMGTPLRWKGIALPLVRRSARNTTRPEDQRTPDSGRVTKNDISLIIRSEAIPQRRPGRGTHSHLQAGRQVEIVPCRSCAKDREDKWGSARTPRRTYIRSKRSTSIGCRTPREEEGEYERRARS